MADEDGAKVIKDIDVDREGEEWDGDKVWEEVVGDWEAVGGEGAIIDGHG